MPNSPDSNFQELGLDHISRADPSKVLIEEIKSKQPNIKFVFHPQLTTMSFFADKFKSLGDQLSGKAKRFPLISFVCI